MKKSQHTSVLVCCMGCHKLKLNGQHWQWLPWALGADKKPSCRAQNGSLALPAHVCQESHPHCPATAAEVKEATGAGVGPCPGTAAWPASGEGVRLQQPRWQEVAPGRHESWEAQRQCTTGGGRNTCQCVPSFQSLGGVGE